LQQKPITSIAAASRLTGLSVPAVTASFNLLQKPGIVRELTSRRRYRLFSYDRYVKILEEGTEPIR
jgi:Fic family protein